MRRAPCYSRQFLFATVRRAPCYCASSYMLIAVLDGLTKIAMLQSFKLEVNDIIGDASGVALAKALKQNTTLQFFVSFDPVHQREASAPKGRRSDSKNTWNKAGK